MDDLGQIIQTAIVVVIVVLFIAFVMAELFYKGRKRTIHVVKKRITKHGGLNSMRSKTIFVKNYSVDCCYDGSDKIHTLGCSFLQYEQLKPNKDYTVIIKLNSIIKICK